MKVRHRPFAVYFKFLAPKRGQGSRLRRGAPRQQGDRPRRRPRPAARPPAGRPPRPPARPGRDPPPVTEAGLANLTAKLIHFRRMDLDDPEAVTILDRTTDDEGPPWFRSLHTAPAYHPDRPFARVEVLYDPETLLPLQITKLRLARARPGGRLPPGRTLRLRGPRPRRLPDRPRLRPG